MFLVRFIPRYVFFVAIINEIAFLISFLYNSLSVYRNATDFYMLVLYICYIYKICFYVYMFCKLTKFVYPNSFFAGIFRVFYMYNYVI